MRRQLTDSKQRWQHPNQIARRLAKHCTIRSIDTGAGGNILGGESSGGSQYPDDLQGVDGNIQQAYKGLGDLPFQENFAEGFFGAFQI